VRLADFGRIVTGKTPPSTRPELFGDLYPFLTPTDIDGIGRYIEPARFLSPEGQDYQQRLMLPERSVCVVCIGATIGKVCMTARPSFTNQQINSVVVNEKEHDPFFVYHLMRTLRETLKANAGGAATPIINKSAFSEIEVRVPTLRVQQGVGDVLSTYDDLIENNTRRIQILERMAQALYREWFVEFRFPDFAKASPGRPGHAKVKRVASPLGPIPQGWEAVRFDGLVESGLGGDWGVDEPDDEENAVVLVIRGTDFDDIVKGSALRTPRRFIAPSSQSKRQLQVGDLVVENSINAKSRCVGTTLLVTHGVLRRLAAPAIAASFCKVYRFKDPALAALAHLRMRYLYAEGRMAFYQNVAANGIGNFQSQRFLESEHLVFPADKKTRQEMLSVVSDLTSSTLADQIFNLRRTRDLLLPKLISGALDVSKLDLETA
jgi:type I restriction enzyme S subunit